MSHNAPAFTLVPMLWCFLCAAVGAEESTGGDIFKLRGYGTLGITHSDQGQADFVSNQLGPVGAGHSDTWSPNVDSKLALQLDAKFSSRLSAVVQLISQSNYDSSWTGSANPRYRPSLEWANIKYEITNELSVRGGRVVLPVNMISEYRNVGYANPFVRPPTETYSAVPFTNYDGFDVTYHTSIGDKVNTLAIFDGGQAVRTDSVKLEAHLYGAYDMLEDGPLTLRASYMHASAKTVTSFTPPGFFPNFAAAAAGLPGDAGAPAAAAAQDFYNRFDTTHWFGFDLFDLGLIYDPGAWFAMAEYFGYRNDGMFGEVNSGWASGGFRYKKLTPYAIYAKVKTTHRDEAGIPLSGLPAPLAAYGAGINGAVAGLDRAFNRSQQSFSVGLRWDVMKHVALKAQYDRVDLDSGSDGDFINPQPGFQPGSNANIFSSTVDFIF